MGAACPLESTNLSLSGMEGSEGSWRMARKYSTDRSSADDKDPPGWPEEAA